MLYFFCKQKTAYEMRISDWSSDVCSSDLMTLHERINRRCGDLTWCQVSTIQGETRLDEIDGRLLCRLPPVSQQRLELFVVGGTHQQIGRASCRDRVCQYV